MVRKILEGGENIRYGAKTLPEAIEADDYKYSCAEVPAVAWSGSVSGDDDSQKLVIHHENCIHCKTCDVADPHAQITWTTPQGGEGPDYAKMQSGVSCRP